MKNSQVGLIVAAVILGAGATIYVPQWQERRQQERDQSSTCVLYRQAVSLISSYIEMGLQDKAVEQVTNAKRYQREGKCTDIL